jgi:hypothetical protein
MIINKPEIATKILINIMLITLFIGSFFILFGSYYGKLIINLQMTFLCENISNSLKFFGKNISQLTVTEVKKIKLPDLIEEDYQVEYNNKQLRNLVIFGNIILCILVITLIYFIKKNYPDSYNLPQIIGDNILILIFVGFTEYLFVELFASKYISIDPNKIKLRLLKTFKKYNYI